MRAFLFLILVFLVFGLVMLISMRIQRMRRGRMEEPPSSRKEKMVKCVVCGTYLPDKRAAQCAEGPCCPEHQS